jgi:class 3 adenylate cyclase
MSRRHALSIVVFVDVLGDGVDSQDEALVRHELDSHGAMSSDGPGHGIVGVAAMDAAKPVRVLAGALGSVRQLSDAGLLTRAGIHVGECSARRSGARGPAVDVAVEVARNAAPGEVLLTGAARNALGQTGQRFVDLGRHELDGGVGTFHLYRAYAPPPPRYGP